MVPEIKITTAQAKQMEDYLEYHMSNCFSESMGEETDLDWEPFGAFCGCFTCESREWLMATFKWLRDNNILDFYVEDDYNNPEQDPLF